MKLRVGLVGLGDAWQQRYAPALRALADQFEVCAVCEQVGHRAEQVACELGVSSVDGFRAMSRREDIDAILILSARWYGALPILAACDNGKAVYCAASIDLEVEQARNIKRRVEESGIAFMAEFPCRHAPATTRLKELIATHLGPPRLIFCHQRRGVEASGSKPTRSHIHELIEAVDWCRYVVDGEPTSVQGTFHKTEPDGAGEDYRMMSLDFSDAESPGTGVIAQISCGEYIPAQWHEAISFRPPAAMQVACQHGTAFIDLPSSLIWFDHAGRHMESLDSERPVGEQLLCDFHRAVTSLVRNTASLEDAYRALSIVIAARKSNLEGRRMPIAY